MKLSPDLKLVWEVMNLPIKYQSDFNVVSLKAWGRLIIEDQEKDPEERVQKVLQVCRWIWGKCVMNVL